MIIGNNKIDQQSTIYENLRSPVVSVKLGVGWCDDGGQLFAGGVGRFLLGDFVATLCFWINLPLR
jgi:hypothetical protein